MRFYLWKWVYVVVVRNFCEEKRSKFIVNKVERLFVNLLEEIWVVSLGLGLEGRFNNVRCEGDWGRVWELFSFGFSLFVLVFVGFS